MDIPPCDYPAGDKKQHVLSSADIQPEGVFRNHKLHSKKVTVKRIPQVNQTDYISNTTVSSGIVRQTCRIAYRYICRHNISIGKGETPLLRMEQVETHTPPSRAAHPLNSLNMLQKNNLKSASVFCSNLLLPLVFFHFSYSSILVPASLYPASHCFPLPFLLLFPSLLPSSSFFFSL